MEASLGAGDCCCTAAATAGLLREGPGAAERLNMDGEETEPFFSLV